MRRNDQRIDIFRAGISISARAAMSGFWPGPGGATSVRQTAEPT
jgi:hypothetical protein